MVCFKRWIDSRMLQFSLLFTVYFTLSSIVVTFGLDLVLVQHWWWLWTDKADCWSTAIEWCWRGSFNDNSFERDGMRTQSWSTAAPTDIIADGKYIRSLPAGRERSGINDADNRWLIHLFSESFIIRFIHFGGHELSEQCNCECITTRVRQYTIKLTLQSKDQMLILLCVNA